MLNWRTHAGGMSILLTTHGDAVADRCERIIRLKDGVVEWDRRLRTRAVGTVD